MNTPNLCNGCGQWPQNCTCPPQEQLTTSTHEETARKIALKLQMEGLWATDTYTKIAQRLIEEVLVTL